LETSRKNRNGAKHSFVLLPEGVDERFKDPEILFGQGLDSTLRFWDYDYLQLFQKNNSLKDGGIPLRNNLKRNMQVPCGTFQAYASF